MAGDIVALSARAHGVRWEVSRALTPSEPSQRTPEIGSYASTVYWTNRVRIRFERLLAGRAG